MKDSDLRNTVERLDHFDTVRAQLEDLDETFVAYFKNVDKSLIPRADGDNVRLELIAGVCIANDLSMEVGVEKGITFFEHVGENVARQVAEAKKEAEKAEEASKLRKNFPDLPSSTKRRRLAPGSGSSSSCSGMPEWMGTIMCTATSTSTSSSVVGLHVTCAAGSTSSSSSSSCDDVNVNLLNEDGSPQIRNYQYVTIPVSRKTIDEKRASWSSMSSSSLTERRRLAQKKPTHGSERHNRLLERLQGRQLAADM